MSASIHNPIMSTQGWWHTESVDGKVPSAKMSDGLYGQLHECLNLSDITSLLVHVHRPEWCPWRERYIGAVLMSTDQII